MAVKQIAHVRCGRFGDWDRTAATGRASIRRRKSLTLRVAMLPVSAGPGTAVIAIDLPNDRSGRRLCENAKAEHFRGSLNPSRCADRPSWSDRRGQVVGQPAAPCVFTQARRAAVLEITGNGSPRSWRTLENLRLASPGQAPAQGTSGGSPPSTLGLSRGPSCHSR